MRIYQPVFRSKSILFLEKLYLSNDTQVLLSVVKFELGLIIIISRRADTITLNSYEITINNLSISNSKSTGYRSKIINSHNFMSKWGNQVTRDIWNQFTKFHRICFCCSRRLIITDTWFHVLEWCMTDQNFHNTNYTRIVNFILVAQTEKFCEPFTLF